MGCPGTIGDCGPKVLVRNERVWLVTKVHIHVTCVRSRFKEVPKIRVASCMFDVLFQWVSCGSELTEEKSSPPLGTLRLINNDKHGGSSVSGNVSPVRRAMIRKISYHMSICPVSYICVDAHHQHNQ